MEFNGIVDTLMNILLDQINTEELNKWVQMEMVHADGNEEKAKKIVEDHIREHGTKYYPALIEMENRLKTERQV
jgi:hypothetical protein